MVPSLPSSAASWSLSEPSASSAPGGDVLAWRAALGSLARQALAAPPPPSIEDPVVGFPIVAPSDEDRGTRGADRVALAEVDEGQGSRVVDSGSEVDRESRGPERPSEPDGLGEETPPVDLAAARRADDRRPACQARIVGAEVRHHEHRLAQRERFATGSNRAQVLDWWRLRAARAAPTRATASSAPAASMATSTAEAWRPTTLPWWISSVMA